MPLSSRLKPLTISIACGFVLSNAQALSARLTKYDLAECASKFCVTATGKEAFLSMYSPTVAAEDVAVVITDLVGKKQTLSCHSMAYFLESSLMTCEESATKTTTVIDLANSQISRY